MCKQILVHYLQTSKFPRLKTHSDATYSYIQQQTIVLLTRHVLYLLALYKYGFFIGKCSLCIGPLYVCFFI